MPKHACRVVGHRLVKRGEVEVLEVKLANAEYLRATINVPVEEAENYPLGCEASLGFSIQQSLALEAAGR